MNLSLDCSYACLISSFADIEDLGPRDLSSLVVPSSQSTNSSPRAHRRDDSNLIALFYDRFARTVLGNIDVFEIDGDKTAH